METLLQGYDEQDEDQVYRVCNSPLLKYMDNDVSCFDIWLRLNLERMCFFVFSLQYHTSLKAQCVAFSFFPL